MKTDKHIYLAPFQGVTTYTFREIYSKYFQGIDKLFTPFFTSVHKTNTLAKRGRDLEFQYQNKIEVVPQILSKDASEILRFANYCHDKGFKEINWNLGCPYPRVANKKRGSGLLPFPNEIDDILNQIDNDLKLKFSVKCRLGYFSEDEIFPLIDVFNKHKISELTIHARIGKQLYKGEVKADVFEKIIDLCNIPLVYNGDIFTSEDFIKFDNNFKTIDKWMIGRGLLRNPFLPAIIKNMEVPDKENQKSYIYKFVTDLYLSYLKKMNGRPHVINVMKEYCSFLSYSFNNQQKVFNLIKKTKSPEEYENAVAFVFDTFEWMGNETLKN
ncbi:MAG: hypothetical protein C0595_03145 [Marinilabiliales bacterium]|nr:MAG: hypothetical protein C0595_03145 [Marinilabiliales bacterium]